MKCILFLALCALYVCPTLAYLTWTSYRGSLNDTNSRGGTMILLDPHQPPCFCCVRRDCPDGTTLIPENDTGVVTNLHPTPTITTFSPSTVAEILQRYDCHTGGVFCAGFNRTETDKLECTLVNISYGPPVRDGPGKVYRIPPQILINDSDKEQLLPFEWQHNYTNSFSWTLPTALNVGITVEATIEVPPVAEGRIPPTMKLSLSTNGEQTSSETKPWKVKTTVKVPPHRRMLCESVITSGVVEVPFLATQFIYGYVTFYYRAPIDRHIEMILSSVEVMEGDVPGWIPISNDERRGIQTDGSGVVRGDFGKSVVTQYTELPLESASDTPLSVRIVPESLQGLPEEELDRLSRNPSELLKNLFLK